MLGYILEVKQEGLDKPSSWTELANRCKNTSYHVRSGLEPLGRYRFRVRAYNTAGVSEPSQESKCINMTTASKRFGLRRTSEVFLPSPYLPFVCAKSQRRKSPSGTSW